MGINAIRLKQNKAPGPTALYELKTDREIEVQEYQTSDQSVDQVILHFRLCEGELGYFSKEYRPQGVEEKGAKKIDITAAVVNQAEQQIKWYLYDIKRTFGGRDVLVHLWNQWNSAWIYLQEHIVQPSGCQEEPHLGVFTRTFERERIEKDLQDCKNACEGILSKDDTKITLALRKRTTEIARLRQFCMVEQAVLDGKFWVADHPDREYDIDIQYLTLQGENTYQAEYQVGVG